MLNFLFWNLNRKELLDNLIQLVSTHEIDVLMLAESTLQPAQILNQLNRSAADYHYASAGSLCKRITVFTRFPDEYITPRYESDKLSIRHLRLPHHEDILLVVFHGLSKRHASQIDQLFEFERLARDIQNMEKRVGHSRTVLVGDMNANPFEAGLTSARALHGIMSRKIVQSEKSRVVQGERYPYFYNPMWNFFGDIVEPVGTYFYRAGHLSYFWNIFDQVLVRPDLLDKFDSNSVKIIVDDGINSLTKADGRPHMSDHLPLFFTLSL